MESIQPVQPASKAVPEGKEPPTRRARKKERTRKAIYDAAMALFAARGFDRVTVEEICEAADVAKATFFLHFSTKAALIFEYGRDVTEEIREITESPSGSAREDFAAVAHLLLRHWSEKREIVEPMLRELLSSPPAIQNAQAEGEQMVLLLADVVRRGQREGEFRKNIVPELAAVTFFSTYSTVVTVLAQRRGKVDLQEFVDQFLDLVLFGLVEPSRAGLKVK